MDRISNATASVWVVGDDVETVSQIEEIAQIVGVETARTSSAIPDSARLIISTGNATAPELPPCPRVHIGVRGDLTLPGDAKLLVQLLNQVGTQSMQTALGALPVVILAGWHGGAGTSYAAYRLAKASKAVLLDASGAPRADFDAHTLNWSQIDAKDPPLRTELQARLPRRKGVRLLSAGGVDAPRPSDPRVLAVAAGCGVHLVIDAGMWEVGIVHLQSGLHASGCPAKTVLVGDDRTKAGSLAAILEHDPGAVSYLLMRARATTEIALICERWRVERLSMPRRKWNALWGRIAHG